MPKAGLPGLFISRFGSKFIMMEHTPFIPTPTRSRDTYTVSRLNREAKTLLEGGFPPLWVEGEVSNLARPGSGHVYFSLKDAQAQIRCALFRPQLRLLRTAPRDGMQVLVRARVSLYEGRGEFQLIVEHLEEAGEGALRRALEALKLRLSREGLFDAVHKKPLPRLPRRIGIITSPTGAVLHDMLTTLRRRFPAIAIRLYPVPVQGQGAAEKIASAIQLAGQRRDCDALILARGGGSLEDLWAFNEEIVARAIHASPLPIVCGVGHETDVTIADLVADARAPTPTAAAEMLSPDRSEWSELYRAYESRLTNLICDRMRYLTQRVDGCHARLVHPRQRIEMLWQRLQALYQRLITLQLTRVHAAHASFDALNARLRECSPLPRARSMKQQCAHLQLRLDNAVRHRLGVRRDGIARLSHALHALSPLATLGRGYAIIRHGETGLVVRDAMNIEIGERIEARVARGRLDCIVRKRHDD